MKKYFEKVINTFKEGEEGICELEELYTKQKILQALRQKQNKAPWSALFVKEKIFFKRG